MSSPLDRRRAGVLLHPTSLPPGPAGGMLGDSALRFIDLIADAGFSVWQMLPVGPVDASLSPYSSKSSFAGNAMLIDIHEAARTLGPGAYDGQPGALLEAARAHDDFEPFLATAAAWLLPWARYAAGRRRHAQLPWWQWPASERQPPMIPPGTPASTLLATLQAESREDPFLGDLAALQFLFELQWRRVRRHAQDRGVLLFGDLPFYTDHDSADVWAERHLFALDAEGQPREVAGVPPDYFSAQGQRWGNPLYAWQAQRDGVFDWWRRRLVVQLGRFDLLRLDHFRALEAHWAIPAEAPDARHGHWRDTPGAALLGSLRASLGRLPLVAEDLGTITPEVLALRDAFELPGMLVLQFAFDGSPDNPYLPARHAGNAVVYTGTHDNDTTLGWYRALDPHTRGLVDSALRDRQGEDARSDAAPDMPDALVACAMESIARLAVIPMQDLLGLGSEARMNVPGVAEGNWRWRFDWAEVGPEFRARWRALADAAGRV